MERSSVAVILLAIAVTVGAANWGCGGGAPGHAATLGESACTKCILGQCGAEFAACDADADCKTYIACVFACPLTPTATYAIPSG